MKMKYFDNILDREVIVNIKRVNKTHWRMSDDNGWTKVLSALETRRMVWSMKSGGKPWPFSRLHPIGG